jgi:hypothetical protein
MDIKVTTKGVQEFQIANLAYIRALEPSGPMDEAVREGILALQRYQATITHVDTEALRGARRVRFTNNAAELFTGHMARNPRTGRAVLEYDQHEEDRGGSHANWQRTFNEAGPRVAATMTVKMLRALG